MPIKIGLVLTNRISQQRPQPKPQPQQKPQPQPINKSLNVPQQPQDINLRRIMGAPKTSCNSCRG